jgi:hypothetical protein
LSRVCYPYCYPSGEAAKLKCAKGGNFVGAQGRNRTTDTRIFSPLLYRLSYLGLAIFQNRRQGKTL